MIGVPRRTISRRALFGAGLRRSAFGLPRHNPSKAERDGAVDLLRPQHQATESFEHNPAPPISCSMATAASVTSPPEPSAPPTRRAGAGTATNGTGTAAAGRLPSFASQTRCLRLPEVPPVPPALPVPRANLYRRHRCCRQRHCPPPACAADRTGWRCKPSCTAANRHRCWLAVFADRCIDAAALGLCTYYRRCERHGRTALFVGSLG